MTPKDDETTGDELSLDDENMLKAFDAFLNTTTTQTSRDSCALFGENAITELIELAKRLAA